jgi:general secretion pathway protein D
MTRTRRTACGALVASLLVGACSTPIELRESRDLWRDGRVDDSLARLQAGMRRLPDDGTLRAEYFRRRDLAAAQGLAIAEQARATRKPDDARAAYERVLAIDANNARARDGLLALDTDRRHDRLAAEAGDLFAKSEFDPAEARVRSVLAENRGHGAARQLLLKLRERQWALETSGPVLKTALKIPISLELRDAPLRAAFDVMARTAGINFVFDRDVRADTRVTVVIRDSPVEDVIRLVLATNQLERKVLNDNSLLIYPNTQAKVREYQDLVVRAFYLGNADVKQAQNLVRTVVKSRDVFIDEKLNVLTIRDTPDAVRLAERLIETIDKAEPEVTLEVEVLEISAQRLRDVGLQFPAEVLAEQQLPTPSGVAADRVRLWRPEMVATVASPAVRLNLLATETDVNLLASPRIRSKSKDKARVLIGEKLPVFTTTAVQNAGISSSVSYIDVGLKLEVEPTVYLDDEVGIKVNLEVNSNLGEVRGPDGSVAFRLGTRSAQTQLRLRDGETQVLAGLIDRSERDTLSRLPGLGDVPGIGRLFSSNRSDRNKSEIVLLITPRIVRNLDANDIDTAPIAGGTELQAGVRPLSIRATAPRSLAVSASGPGTPAQRQADAPPAAAPAAGAAGTASAAARPAGPLVARLRVPEQAALGREVTLAVEVPDAGTALDGEAVLDIEPPLLQGAGGSRVTVRLSASGGVLSGSVTLRAQTAGAGSVNIEVVEGRARIADGSTQPIASGARTTLRIGL